jgi:hypothetical protein
MTPKGAGHQFHCRRISPARSVRISGMNRRDFVQRAGMAVAGFAAFSFGFRTRHVIWIINGNGSRKADWYGNPKLSPNLLRLAGNGFVYEESENDSVAHHGYAWTELITGHPHRNSVPAFPTPLHYIRGAYGDAATRYWFINGAGAYRQWRFSLPACDDSTSPVSLTAAVASSLRGIDGRERQSVEEFLEAGRASRVFNNPDAHALDLVPRVLKEFKPRMIICQLTRHDSGHGGDLYSDDSKGFLAYTNACRTADEGVGKLLDFVTRDPYFSTNTAIVVRPEFGRDDEINRYGELHHSEGFYQSHRSAEIWWGPDFKTGVCRTLTNRRDFVPSLTRLFNVNATYATGRVHPEMFRLPVLQS